MKKDIKETLEIIGMCAVSYILVMQLNSLIAKGHTSDPMPIKQEQQDSIKKFSNPDTLRTLAVSKLQKTR
ncbi:MAG: hypothetical protein IIV74_01165 [Alphaproteobacteria bacterium]|nr:hypothetical protein [Alphaproteobacteria bacterium]